MDRDGCLCRQIRRPLPSECWVSGRTCSPQPRREILLPERMLKRRANSGAARSWSKWIREDGIRACVNPVPSLNAVSLGLNTAVAEQVHHGTLAELWPAGLQSCPNARSSGAGVHQLMRSPKAWIRPSRTRGRHTSPT